MEDDVRDRACGANAGIQHLPAHLLSNLFAQLYALGGPLALGRVATVCRSFSEFGGVGRAWHTLDLTSCFVGPASDRDMQLLQYVARKMPKQVISLHLRTAPGLERTLAYGFPRFKCLQSLDLSGCADAPPALQVSAKALLRGLSLLPSLDELSLRGFNIGLPLEVFLPTSLARNQLTPLGLPRQTVSACEVQMSTIRDFLRQELPEEAHTGGRLASLSSIDARGASVFSITLGQVASPAGIKFALPAWVLLPFLVSEDKPVRRLRLGWDGETQSLPAVYQILFSFSQEGFLPDLDSLGGTIMNVLMTQAPNLEVLDWCGAYHLSTELSSVLPKAINLVDLRLNACESMVPHSFNRMKCPHLRSLNVRRLQHFHGSAALAAFGGCPNLQRVNLSCTPFGDEEMEYLLMCCPLLEAVDLCYSGVTEKGAMKLVHARPQLRMLGLSGLSGVSCQHIDTISEMLPLLEFLALGGHPNPTGQLLSSNSINDAALKKIAANCQSLSKLYLQYLRNITDSGVKAVMEGCGKLQELLVKDCDGVGDAVVEAVQQRFSVVSEYNGDDI
mmetsp:Transcript_32475/g.92033  ORF Transcript_32475/g.92033 Transcript_32475/m.92033 type:complete len:560 (+) Transcript_32475:358-2037(+)